jgi:hypothetical protein
MCFFTDVVCSGSLPVERAIVGENRQKTASRGGPVLECFVVLRGGGEDWILETGDWEHQTRQRAERA